VRNIRSDENRRYVASHPRNSDSVGASPRAIEITRLTRQALLKVRAQLGEFDGEEGLDAGVEVERVAGPAGPDGFGVGMLEAVHAAS
jgi:hypothetical protein